MSAGSDEGARGIFAEQGFVRLPLPVPVDELGAELEDVREVLAMSPLLLHASSKATAPGRRRVVHVELCALPLTRPARFALEP